ncbi:hypothetical protein J2S25_001994 [Mesobacillus stamsii]|uniref:Uncharacterized protein n=1 Tax=Mesobacillus stamsii TaxID=225347 RepID=A0ABU0FV48_9BACI|nr:hypothetical protein [Mesobacillus stamsii]
MKKNNWLLFLLILLLSIGWGAYYWFFIVPGQ